MFVRYRRPMLVALFALAVLAVGAWVDIARAGRTDLVRDPLSTAIVLVFGAIAGDVALTALTAVDARWRPRPAARMAAAAAIGALAVLAGHALTPLMALAVQIPRVGLAMIPTIGLGMEYVIRQALVPALVAGAITGAIAALALPAASRGPNAAPGRTEPHA